MERRVTGRKMSRCAWADAAVEIWDGGQWAHVRGISFLDVQFAPD